MAVGLRSNSLSFLISTGYCTQSKAFLKSIKTATVMADLLNPILISSVRLCTA